MAEEPGLKVTLDGEMVDQAVLKAVTESAFGKKLEEAINAELQDFGKGLYSRDNALRRAVRDVLMQIVTKTIQDDYRGAIENLVKEKITDEFVETAFSKLWETFLESRL